MGSFTRFSAHKSWGIFSPLPIPIPGPGGLLNTNEWLGCSVKRWQRAPKSPLIITWLGEKGKEGFKCYASDGKFIEYIARHPYGPFLFQAIKCETTTPTSWFLPRHKAFVWSPIKSCTCVCLPIFFPVIVAFAFRLSLSGVYNLVKHKSAAMIARFDEKEMLHSKEAIAI